MSTGRVAPLAQVLLAMLLLAAPMGLASRAYAQSAPTATDRARAKESYRTGLLKYELGDFEAAIEAFRKAYALTSAPPLLFNIAQAYRLKKDYAPAVHFYRTFLRLAPTSPSRPEVEQRLAECERALAEQQAASARAAEKAAADKAAAEKASAERAEKEQDAQRASEEARQKAEGAAAAPELAPMNLRPHRGRGRALKLAGVVSFGAGVALIIAGAVSGAQSASAADQISNAARPRDQMWSPDLAQAYANGQSAAQRATVLYGVGGGLLGAGLGLYGIGLRIDRTERISVGAGTRAGGGEVNVRWRF
jgi:tetratricopeptide (TPR) repeat protein